MNTTQFVVFLKADIYGLNRIIARTVFLVVNIYIVFTDGSGSRIDLKVVFFSVAVKLNVIYAYSIIVVGMSFYKVDLRSF